MQVLSKASATIYSAMAHYSTLMIKELEPINATRYDDQQSDEERWADQHAAPRKKFQRLI